MRPFRLYPPDLLPSGFVYPEKLRRIADSGSCPEIGPWWFVDAESEAGVLFYNVREYEGRNLVPFAKANDDIACFDGDDRSGNPTVLMLVLDESGRKYSFEDFDRWMSAAQSNAAG